MKKILLVSAPILAIVSQNAFAEDAKKDEKMFSVYGSVYATQGLYSSEVAKARNALTTNLEEFRPGLKGNFGAIKSDVQFDMKANFSGDGGKDWDRNDAAIKLDPETSGDNTNADKVYKSLWNSKIRKAQLETTIPTGCVLKAGLIRPTGAASNGFYLSTGLEGYGNGLGASLVHEFDLGAVKVTPEFTVLNKVHLNSDLVAASPAYNVTPSDKALHVAVTGSIAEKTSFAFAYGGNYNSTSAAGVNHLEASVAHTMDAINAGVWMERNAYHTNAKNFGNVLKFGLDAGYAVNENVKAIAGFAQTVSYSKSDATGASVETKDKALNEIFVGPRFSKGTASAEFAMRYAMDADETFKDSDGKKADSAMSAWMTIGYEL